MVDFSSESNKVGEKLTRSQLLLFLTFCPGRLFVFLKRSKASAGEQQCWPASATKGTPPGSPGNFILLGKQFLLKGEEESRVLYK